jgi:hypothetical protein
VAPTGRSPAGRRVYDRAATWLAGETHLGRRDAKAAVRQMRLLGRHPLLDAATTTGAVTISWAREIAPPTPGTGSPPGPGAGSPPGPSPTCV